MSMLEANGPDPMLVLSVKEGEEEGPEKYRDWEHSFIWAFSMGTMNSSKCSMAMVDRSRSPCSRS